MATRKNARYYERIGTWILPHVAGRPLMLVHCPAGLAAPCSYLKHAKAWGPSALRRVRIQEKTKVGEYLVADSIEAVVSLAQMGVVEIHTWNALADDVDRPNRLVWDLSDAAFAAVARAAGQAPRN
jgi:bifunctional non-homologous end joining protein LigD